MGERGNNYWILRNLITGVIGLILDYCEWIVYVIILVFLIKIKLKLIKFWVFFFNISLIVLCNCFVIMVFILLVGKKRWWR